MTCPNCKRKNADDAVFCVGCGGRLGDQLTPRKGVKCPAGKHLMDPGWKTCPYCAATPADAGQKASPPNLGDLGKTKIAQSEDPRGSADSSGLGKTKIMPGHDAAGNPQSAGLSGHSGRIVGALITYDWNKQGDLYPVTEGKNFIGSGKTTEGHLCDICIPLDDEMSREHALLLFRKADGFTLADRTSSNGTTNWRFVSFELPGSPQAPAPEPVKTTTEELDAR
jgi:hypothetical protein